MKYLFILTLLLGIGFNASAQDPQTNAPNIIYPMVDEFIKRGYNHNLRRHTKVLNTIDYILIVDVPSKWVENPRLKSHGDFLYYKYYEYYKPAIKDVHYTIALSEDWINHPIMLRRMFFQAIGKILGIPGCHDDCTHIMGNKPAFSITNMINDKHPERWEEEINIYFHMVGKAISEVYSIKEHTKKQQAKKLNSEEESIKTTKTP